METILNVASIALLLAAPVAALIRAGALRTVPAWLELTSAERVGAEKFARELPDLSRVIEGEYYVVQEAARTWFRIPQVIITP